MLIMGFGLLLCTAAFGCLLYAILASPVARVAPERRVAINAASSGLLEAVGDMLVEVVERIQLRRGKSLFSAQDIELAGFRTTPSSLVVTVIAGAVSAFIIGIVLTDSLLMALIFAALVPPFTKMIIRTATSRRRRAFATQLDAAMQLLGSALRAGHSFTQAMNAVAKEADSPSAEEFARIVNENRLGRDMVTAMHQTSERMLSEDFAWVADAVAIQRDTGGNLSEVLDRVGETIRERSELKAKVASLATEGKASALILMALPVVVGLFYTVFNFNYMRPLYVSDMGHILLGVSGVLFAIAAVWLRAIVNVKF